MNESLAALLVKKPAATKLANGMELLQITDDLQYFSSYVVTSILAVVDVLDATTLTSYYELAMFMRMPEQLHGARK